MPQNTRCMGELYIWPSVSAPFPTVSSVCLTSSAPFTSETQLLMRTTALFILSNMLHQSICMLPQQEEAQRVHRMAAGTRGQGHDRHGCQFSLTGCWKTPVANEGPVAEGTGHLVPPKIPPFPTYHAKTPNMALNF